jgi:uncharacterized cupredoxin-like copper-binding protein
MTKKKLQLSLATFALFLLLSACQPQAAQTIEITLTEFGIQSPLTTFQAGQPYRFVITNAGALNHEFTIMPPMSADAGTSMEGHSMEHMAGALLHVGEDELTPGGVVTVEFTFSEATNLGEIEFACHLPGHYEAGMFIPISVES